MQKFELLLGFLASIDPLVPHPGSTVIRISQDSKKFFIHSIDVSEKEKDSLLRSIKHYEDLILEVSR